MVLALWIKEAKHFVAFTGAGISTAAGISDYRSGVNTVLNVGPGVWEKKKHNIKTKEKKTSEQKDQAEKIEIPPSELLKANQAIEKKQYEIFLKQRELLELEIQILTIAKYF